MGIYYHVSTKLNHNGIFEPRVPQSRHKQAEDDRTPRVSVAPTIESCLTAIPGGGIELEELNIQLRGYYLVFRIDTDKLGIQEKFIVDADTLYENDWVRDADATNEHWITVPFTVPEEDIFAIKVIAWDESSVDIVPFSLHEIADKNHGGDLGSAYFEVYDDNLPCSTLIEDLRYIREDVNTGEEISIYIDEEGERECILSFLNRHYKVNILRNDIDELVFSLEEQSNLRQLFIYHQRICMVDL